MHEKKIKGDIGFACVLSELIKQGWNVCIPTSEHTSYDLIAEKNGICKRVQVRYTSKNDNRISVKLRSCWSDRNGCHTKTREKSDFDTLAVYSPDDIFCFVDSSEFKNGTGINFCINDPKNNQKKNIRLVKNYTIMPL
jgi:hypothetical protein